MPQLPASQLCLGLLDFIQRDKEENFKNIKDIIVSQVRKINLFFYFFDENIIGTIPSFCAIKNSGGERILIL